MNKKNIAITIVIPIVEKICFNHHISSILKENNNNTEIILVCDEIKNKKKNNIQMLDNFNIVVRYINNTSVGTKRNLGLYYATGKYVVFLDSDDIFCPDMLEKAYNKMEENNLDICIWNAWELDNETGNVYGDTTHLRPELLPDKEVFAGDEAEYILNLTSAATWNKMYSREFLLKHELKYMEQKYFNDIFFVQQALVHAKRISVINEELMYYRINNKNSLQGNRSKGIKDYSLAIEANYSKFKTEGLLNGTVRTSFFNYVLSCTLAILKGKLEEYAFDELIEFVKSSPIYKEISLEDVHYYQKELYDELQMILNSDISDIKGNFKQGEERQRPIVKTLEILYPDNYLDLLYSDYCLKQIKMSKSYKIGMGITFPFRKIKSFLNRQES